MLGVNGAGKSTTFKMLTGEETASRGEVYGNGFYRHERQQVRIYYRDDRALPAKLETSDLSRWNLCRSNASENFVCAIQQFHKWRIDGAICSEVVTTRSR